jgi:hypothetical protein
MRLLKSAIGGMCVSLVAVTVLLLAACPQQRSIAEIIGDPGRYANKDVALKGTVVQSFGAMGTGMYEVDDGTGKIWVYSQNRSVPGKGVRLGVSGRVQPTFTFAGKSFATVLRESDRRQ